MNFVPRKMRRSQAITTFGPGAIVDLREESVMMAGLDFWPSPEKFADRENLAEIHEPNLEKLLNVSHFRTPTGADRQNHGKNLPIVLFPEWVVCPKCRRLGHYLTIAGNPRTSSRGLKCRACNSAVYPARLVIACENGHIDDFPWVEWIKHGSTPCTCTNPALQIYSLGKTAALSDLIVSCKNDGCSGRRSLSGATSKENLKFHKCSGRRPWLDDHDPEKCDQEVLPLQRGASNVYFSSLVSAISIPPWSGSVYAVTRRDWKTFRALIKTGNIDALKDTLAERHFDTMLNLPVDQITDLLVQKYDFEEDREAEKTEYDIRRDEWQALRNPGFVSKIQDDFRTRDADIHKYLQPYISKVVLVDKLREVRALRGFTRISPPAPSAEGNSNRLVRLSRQRMDWLPAIEVYGEGIYLELNPSLVARWSEQKDIIKRAKKVDEQYIAICQKRGWEVVRSITPALLLVHSFSHALIRQLSLDSGYSASSIRERLYVDLPGVKGGDHPYGILLYTSTPDSEGSLGGLVRQGYPEKFLDTVIGAVEDASWCSSDPLCIESQGQGPDSLNLAACHSCLLLPETCCEEYNRLLDRATLVGSLAGTFDGYFKNLVN